MTDKHTTIIAFSGPSGSGKTELSKRLFELYPDNLTRWKQATTRAKRGPGDDYLFVSKEQYGTMVSMLTCRTEFNGQSYGTFPEQTPDDVAVLTVVDVMGLADLERDIVEHNKRVAAGFPGKFGERAARLVRVLLCYTVTEEALAKRRDGRTIEFVQGEISRLAGIKFDAVIDTTNDSWPDPVEFFEKVIWPAVTGPVDAESPDEIRQGIRTLCGTLITRTAGMDVAELRDLREALTSLVSVPSEPAAAVADGVDAVLDGLSDDPLSDDDDGSSPEAPTDYLNDRSGVLGPEPEPVEPLVGPEPEPVEPLLGPEPEPVEPLLGPEPEPVEPLLGPEPEPVEPLLGPEPEPVEPLLGPEPEPVAEQATSVQPYAKIFEMVDITDWMADQAIGIETFETEHAFLTTFSQYVSANGGDPNGIQVSSQVAKDGRGGRVVEFVAILPDGSRYGVEFNERIRRVANHGPR